MDHKCQRQVNQLCSQFVLMLKQGWLQKLIFQLLLLHLKIAIVNFVPKIGFFVNFLGSSFFSLRHLVLAFLSVIFLSLLVFCEKDIIYFVICQTIFKVEAEAHGEHLQEEVMVSGKGPTPPDVDAIIRDIQSKINKFFYLVEAHQEENQLY
jgi:hypothetical protein